MNATPAIAFVSSMERVPWGGSEALWYGAAKHLSNAGCRILISYKDWNNSAARENLRLLKDKGAIINWRKPVTRAQRWLNKITSSEPLNETTKLKRFLKENHPVDLVCISQGNFRDGAWAMQAANELGIPYSVVVQANAEFLWPSDELNRTLVPLYLSAQKVYCVSQANLDLLQCQLATRLSNAEVVYNPFNVSWNPALEWPVEKNDETRLACVARLEPDAKGQDLILQTLACDVWRNRPLSVHFYGTGQSEEGVKRLALNLNLSENQVRFHGQVADVESIWRDNHALLLTSRYEGLPLALVESMLCQRPPIVTDIAGARELVADGDNGYLIPAPHPDLVHATLERAWNERASWKEKGHRAQATIHQRLPENPCQAFADKLAQGFRSSQG